MKNKEYENIVKVPLSPIGQDELDANSVGEVQIQNGAITAKKIRAGQILTDHLAAGAVTADKIFSNAISTYSLIVSSRVKGSTVVFNVVSDGTYLRKLTWTSGALNLSKVVFGEGENLGDITETTISQSISSGSYTFTESDTNYYFYVVWEADDKGEPKDSATLTVQKSTEYPTTKNAVPLIYAWYDSSLKMVQFRAVNSINGVLISGNSIIAGSIQADNIKAGTITTQKLNFTPYVIGTNTLDDVVNGTTYKRVKSAAIDANGMILLDQTTDGTYSKVLSTDIQAGHIKLDSVVDGVYGKTLSTDIYAGHIKLTSTVDSSGNYYFSDSNGFLKGLRGFSAPSGSGLYIGASYLGYYNGSNWMTYMDSSGNFYLGGTNGYLVWNGSSLTIGNTSYGYLQATSSSISIRTSQSGGNLGIQNNVIYFYSGSTTYGSLIVDTYNNLVTLSASYPCGLDVGNSSTSYHIKFPSGGICNIMYGTSTIASFSYSVVSFSQPISCSSYITASSYCQVSASSGIYFGSSSYRLYYSTNYIFTSADIELGNSYGITKSSGYKINWDSSSFRFYDGNRTIYFRYGNSKIQGSVDGSNWYDLW